MPVIIGGLGSLFYASLIFLIFPHAFSLEGFILGFIWLGVVLSYFKAMQIEEASRVIAFYGLVPIFVSALAYLFLGEIFSAGKYAGIALLVIGGTVISVKRDVLSRAVPFMVLSVLFYSIYLIGLKHALATTSFVSIFASMQLALFFGSCVPLISSVQRKAFMGLEIKTPLLVLSSQLIFLIGLLLLMYAISLGPVSLINALENSQSAFTLAYAVVLAHFKPHLIKEDISKGVILSKIIGVFCIIVGASLVA
jgi:drug/metabolite transporter (DMT)-like permease